MLKHRGNRQDWWCWNTKEAITVSGQQSSNRCSYTRMPTQSERNSRGWNSPRLAMLKQHQQQREGAVTLAVTTIPHSAPVIAFGCVRLGHPMLVYKVDLTKDRTQIHIVNYCIEGIPSLNKRKSSFEEENFYVLKNLQRRGTYSIFQIVMWYFDRWIEDCFEYPSLAFSFQGNVVRREGPPSSQDSPISLEVC